MTRPFFILVILISFYLLQKHNYQKRKNVWIYPIFIINLKRTKSRLEHFENFPFQFTRFPGIDGKTLDLKKVQKQGFLRYSNLSNTYMNKQSKNKPLTLGALGCFLSHIQLWEKCISINKPILILEDDVTITSNFLSINEFLNNIPLNWDIIYVGYHNTKSIKKTLINKQLGIFQLHERIGGTHSYIINPETCKLFLKTCKPIDTQVDKFMNEHFKNLNIYGPHSTQFFKYSGFGTLIQ
tara:strand:+ start:406 stop:1122 length:717 start_codon:yes stop_codon:yes gene_type:complete